VAATEWRVASDDVNGVDSIVIHDSDPGEFGHAINQSSDVLFTFDCRGSRRALVNAKKSH
jgi:hypothetical protein